VNLKKCACVETLFTELPWEDRFRAAGEAGFEFVEFWSWTDKDLGRIRDLAAAAGVGIAGFNGDADYSPIDPAHRGGYLDFLGRSLAAARRVGARSLTVHSNALGPGGAVADSCPGLSEAVKYCSLFDTLRASVPLAEEAGVGLNLEALNVTTDHPGNFLAHSRTAAEICRLIASPRLKILFDVYHMQLNEGSLCDNLSACADQLGHIHVADAPGRHEPGTGEIRYSHVFAHLEKLGYAGLVGYELFPLRSTSEAVAAIMAF
jgi:hydroxypyruvate isomerase